MAAGGAITDDSASGGQSDAQYPAAAPQLHSDVTPPVCRHRVFHRHVVPFCALPGQRLRFDRRRCRRMFYRVSYCWCDWSSATTGRNDLQRHDNDSAMKMGLLWGQSDIIRRWSILYHSSGLWSARRFEPLQNKRPGEMCKSKSIYFVRRRQIFAAVGRRLWSSLSTDLIVAVLSSRKAFYQCRPSFPLHLYPDFMTHKLVTSPELAKKQLSAGDVELTKECGIDFLLLITVVWHIAYRLVGTYLLHAKLSDAPQTAIQDLSFSRNF